MAATNKKLKLLLFGPVQDQIVPFCNKIKSLHKSKAGPFDLCFCVGSFHVPSDETSSDYQALQSLPIPVYLQDAVATGRDEQSDEIQTLLEPNLKAFPATKSNVYNVAVDSHPHVNLVVASCPRSLRMDDQDDVKPLMDKLKHVSYVGCDLLLTSHWPQGMENLDNGSMAQQAQLCATYDVAEIALRARARYHFVPAHSNLNLYWQSPPFGHLKATTSTQTPQHTGRVIAMGKVVPDKKVPKAHKFVHAVGVVPLHFMDQAELQASLGTSIAPCPFTDASYQKDSEASSQFVGSAGGLSEAQARRLIAEGAGAGPTGRWNLNPKKRPHGDNNNNEEEEEIDPTNTTLFVHGLHRDVSGQLQQTDNPLLLEAFRPYGAIEVRRPPNARTTAFAFLEFETHEAARLCWEKLGGQIIVAGIRLQVKWGKPANNNNTSGGGNPANKRQKLTEADAKDSTTLYFRLPKYVPEEQIPAAAQVVQQWMESTLEDALNEEGSETRVTAKEEPALQVELQWSEGHAYGFLNFASHAAASMALATLTGSTDGGMVVNPNNTEEEKKTDLKKEDGDSSEAVASKEKTASGESSGDKATSGEAPDDKPSADQPTSVDYTKVKKIWDLALQWALGTKSDKENDVIQDADCDFTFRRQHFPADARQDCWFCLASEGCEKHLITGVYEQCYAAMPKGAMHKGHVLLIPVAHSSQGAFMDKSVSREIQDLQSALRKHAQEQYDCDLFVFERAIQTRGGYHTHVQCVPVPKGLNVKLETTLRAQARANKFEFREIQSPDLDVSTLLQGDDEDEGGYFYAEIPMPGGKLEYKRFLYKVQADQREGRVPLQFGREVIAAVLGKSELAHWKACQVEKSEETMMALDLRQSFEQYYAVDQ